MNANQINVLSISVMMSVALSLIACAPAHFEQLPGSAPLTTSGEGGPDESGGRNPDGDSDASDPSGSMPGGSMPGGSMPGGGDVSGQIPQGSEPNPKIQFIGPPCLRGSNCLVEFELVSPAPLAFSFNWRTDDQLYSQAPPPGEPIFGQPYVHYLPTSGSVTFSPGEIKKTVYVQNINPKNIPIVIGVLMSQCQYGGVNISCRVAFE